MVTANNKQLQLCHPFTCFVSYLFAQNCGNDCRRMVHHLRITYQILFSNVVDNKMKPNVKKAACICCSNDDKD